MYLTMMAASVPIWFLVAYFLSFADFLDYMTCSTCRDFGLFWKYSEVAEILLNEISLFTLWQCFDLFLIISRSTVYYILELPLCIWILFILFGLASFDDEIIQSSCSWCMPGSKTRSVSYRLRSKEAIRENADANVSFFSKCIRPDCIDWPHERKYKPRNETFILLSLMYYQE